MQSLNGRIGSKIRLKWTVPWFSVFVYQTNLKIIWKFSLSQYRCHKIPIDVENCVKSALNSNLRKQNITVITNWGGGDYQLRSACRKTHLGGGDYSLRNSGLPPSFHTSMFEYYIHKKLILVSWFFLDLVFVI